MAMKPDGPTMSTEEIARWEAALKQRVVAQREHKAKYRGTPGKVMTIKAERKQHPKPVPQGCVHRRRIEEVNGPPHVQGVCVHCGDVKTYRASGEYDVVPLRQWTQP